MKVIVNNASSNTEPIKFGVPQGSCAGPVIFTMYIAALNRVVQNTQLNFMVMLTTIELLSEFKLEMHRMRHTFFNS
jgi:hypothetical protein